MTGSASVTVLATTYLCGCHVAATEAGYVAELEYCDDGRTLAARLHRSRLHRRSLSFDSTRLMDALGEVEKNEKTLERHRLSAGSLTILSRTNDPALLPRDGFLRPLGGVRLTRVAPDEPPGVAFTLKLHAGASPARDLAARVRRAGFEVPVVSASSVYPLVPAATADDAPRVLLDALRNVPGEEPDTDPDPGSAGAPRIEVLSHEAASFWAFVLDDDDGPPATAGAVAERSA